MTKKELLAIHTKLESVKQLLQLAHLYSPGFAMMAAETNNKVKKYKLTSATNNKKISRKRQRYRLQNC